jgi:pantetheine-phosphate adenylyltransferase
MSNALFGGSFNPYTVGHHAVFKAAQESLGKDNIIIGIAQNPGKKDINRDIVKWKANPAFEGFDSNLVQVVDEPMLADYAKSNYANVLVRSMRNPIDLAQELALADLNKDYGMNTVFVPGESKYSHVSSSAVNSLRSLHKDVNKFFVNDIQHARYLNNKPKRIIVVGDMGSGKSSFIKDCIEPITGPTVDMDKVVKNEMSDIASNYFKGFFFTTPASSIKDVWYDGNETLNKHKKEVTDIILRVMGTESYWDKPCFEISAFTCYEDLDIHYCDSVIVYVDNYESKIPKKRQINETFKTKADTLKNIPKVVDFVIDSNYGETHVNNIVKNIFNTMGW